MQICQYLIYWFDVVFVSLVIKKVAGTFARPLRNCYHIGIFSAYWKIDNIKQVPKKSNSTNRAN